MIYCLKASVSLESFDKKRHEVNINNNNTNTLPQDDCTRYENTPELVLEVAETTDVLELAEAT